MKLETTQEHQELEKLIDGRIKLAIAEVKIQNNIRFRWESETKIYGLLVVCLLLLGFVGGHRIYAGKWVSGLLMCLAGFVVVGMWFVWFSAPNGQPDLAVGGLVGLFFWQLHDLYKILTKQFTDPRGDTIGEPNQGRN